MALELKQSLKMTQQLVMTPQLQQAIKLLQLSRLELTEVVREEMLENPLLEEQSEAEMDAAVREATGPTVDDLTEKREPAENVTDPKGSDVHEQIDWERYLENYQQLGPTAGTGGRPDSDELPGIDQTLTRSATLFEHLIWQVRLSSFTEEEVQAATFIIGNLDDNGYFKAISERDPLIACARAAEVSLTVAERALRKVQSLDPPGVAARDLVECLLIQARQIGEDDTIVGEIIRNHLKLVESRNPQAIAKTLGVPVQAVIQAIKIIQEMEPRPGRQHTGSEPQYIVPDVYVYRLGDRFMTVVSDDDGLSKLRVSSLYRSVLANGQGGDAKDYIRERLRSAQFLIRSIHQRQRTIHKVTESIVRFQREFFEKGVAYLRPLILRHVAEDIGMHESTVSRVTSNKYLHCAQGIYELKFFFNSSIASSTGDDVASEAVKSRLRALVAAEDVKKPLSDQKIVDMLAKEGIEIARRTVAKYRDQLGILPSSKRKRLY